MHNESTNNYSSFTLRTALKDEAGNPITFENEGLLDDVDVNGEAKCYIVNKATNAYASTNDGVQDITLNGVYCYAEGGNSNIVYYYVRGGLPAGDYEPRIEFSRKNELGQWNPRLITKRFKLKVYQQDVSITEE